MQILIQIIKTKCNRKKSTIIPAKIKELLQETMISFLYRNILFINGVNQEK